MATTGPADHSLNIQLRIQEAIPGLINKLKGEFGLLGSAIHIVSDLFKNFNKALIAIGQVAFLGTILLLARLVKMIVVMDENIAIMGQRYGMSKIQIKEFNAQIYEASKRAGIMADQTAHMAKTLMEAGFKDRKGELASLSATLFQFSAVTGVSAETAAEFVTELNRIGYSSDKLLQQLASLRTSLSLSTKEFENVMKITQKAADLLYIFGNATDKNVLSVGKLAGVLTHLGIEGESISEIISSLMDPRKLFSKEGNIFSLLGYDLNVLQKHLQRGFGLEDIIDLQNRIRNLGWVDNDQMMQTMVWTGKISDAQAKWLRQILGLRAENIAKAIDQQNTDRKLQDLYMDMGKVLEPLRKQWIALLSEILPIIRDQIVPAVTKFLEKLIEIAKWIRGNKDAVKEIIDTIKVLAFIVIGAGVFTWFVNLSRHINIALRLMRNMGDTARVALGWAGKLFGAIGIATTVVGIATKKSFTLNDIAMFLVSLSMMGALGPYGLIIGGIAGLFLLSQHLPNWLGGGFMKKLGATGIGWEEGKPGWAKGGFGAGEETIASTANIKQISDETTAVKADEDRKNKELMQQIADDINKMSENVPTQNQLAQGLIQVIKHESRAERAERLNREAAQQAASSGGT